MNKKNLNKKDFGIQIGIYGLVSILTLSPLGSIVFAQDLPVSTPIELPVSAPVEELPNPEHIDEVIEEVKDKFEGFTEEEVDDATAKVREALIAPAEDDFFVVKFADEAAAERVTAEVAPENVVPERYTHLLGEDVRLIKIDNEEEKVDQMTRFNLDDSVEYVETNQIVKKEAWTVTSTTAKPNDFNNTNHWYHVKTKLAENYKTQDCPSDDACGGSSSVLVAILDTGAAFETNTGATYREYLGGSSYVDRTPLDFTAASEITGINYWTNPSEDYGGGDEDANMICDDLHGADMVAYVDNLSLVNASQWSDGCTAGTSWIVKEGHPNDDDGHGTYVANMIASITDNGTSSFGAAFKTTIMPIKVLDYTGTGTTFTIAQGIRYAVNKGAKILNVSIAGLTTPSATIEDALSYAKDNNVLVVISSGNHGTTSSSLEYPAAYAATYWNVISVGASTNTDTRASYSNYGTGLDLVAPVGTGASAGNATYGQTFTDADSWSAAPLVGRNFTSFSNKFWIGTSFAAPQVTAAAAMMKAVRPDLTKRLKQIIQGTTTDISTAGYDTQTGYGILNVQAAVDAAIVDEGEYPGGFSRINSIVYNNKLYQVVRGQTDRIYIRNFNGSVWTDWKFTNGETPGEISLAVYNNKLYMTIRGGSTNIFVNTFDGTNYTGWQLNGGETPGEITSIVYNGKLYQGIRGNSGPVYIRTLSGNSWSGWTNTIGETPGQIAMAVFNNKLYISIRGGSTNMYTNIFDGTNYTGWIYDNGQTPSEIYSAVYNGKLYQSIRGNSSTIYIRSNNGSGWTGWINTGGETPGEISMATYNSRLFISIRGGSTNIYINTLNGDTYSGWVYSDGQTPTEIVTLPYNGLLYQAIRGGSSPIYIRTNNGSGWGGWQNQSGVIDLN